MSGARSESRLESLPMELLFKIVCHLPHDQLKPVFHVSKRIREAVQTAKKTHFDYTTPRRRSGRVSTPPAEHLPFPWEMMGRVF
ncbi:F-box protein At4g35930-like isoform X2 [Corylus avellana]|uniref:F-box protein At4g35930-like isoform X2 n=1 Tax=Corylus avellana TaxID=13451 RepID=UPI00286C9705|nr:F-box protein At4g35930-like isoform X2 [Corylus avellana]